MAFGSYTCTAVSDYLYGNFGKCGFQYQWRSEGVDVPLMHEKRTGFVSVMTREDWERTPLKRIGSKV